MKVRTTAKLLGTSEQFVRCAMRTGRLDIGACAKLGKKQKRFAFVIVPEKLAKYMGIPLKELERRVEVAERKNT